MATQTEIIRALEARVLKLVLRAMNRVATRFTREVLAAGDPIDGHDLGKVKQLWEAEVPDLAVDIAAIYASVGGQTAAKAGAVLPSTLQLRYLEDATNRLGDIGDDLWHAAAQTLSEGVQAGEGYDALRSRLMDEFAKGGTQLGESRANRIARTEVQSAVNLGSFDAVKSINAEQRPVYKQWLCVAPGTRIAASQPLEVVERRRGAGDVAVVTTAAGRVLAVTPDHPVLTLDGWASARTLQPGDKVICHRDDVNVLRHDIPTIADGGRRAARVGPDIEHAPPAVDEIYRAASKRWFGRRVVLSVVDLDSDPVDCEVDVVPLEGALRDRLKTTAHELGSELLLELSDVALDELFRDRLSGNGVLTEGASVLGTDGRVASRTHIGGQDGDLFRDAANAHTVFNEGPLNDWLGDTASSGDLLQCHATFVVRGDADALGEAELDALGFGTKSLRSTCLLDRGRIICETQAGRFTDVAQSNTCSGKTTTDGRDVGTVSLSDLPPALAGLVATDEVVNVELQAWPATCFYDLSTINGWFFAEGIIVHNSTLDDRTRPDHADADGQVVPLDEPFIVGGDELMQPGDPNGPLDQILNCRCVALFTDNPDGEDSDNRQFLSDEDMASVLDAWSSEVGNMQELEDVTAADSGEHAGTGMIALVPSASDAARLVVPNGDPEDQLHVTLAFLGGTDSMADGTKSYLQDALTELARMTPPLDVEAWSANFFNPNGEEPCWTLGIGHHDQLETVHNGAMDVANTPADDGWTLAEQHTPWVPHLSLTYSQDTGLINTVMSKCGPLTLDRLRLCIGTETWDYPLGATVTTDQGDPMPETELAASDTVTPAAVSFSTARIRGVTLLDVPAFTEARIAVTGPPDENGMQPWAGPITIEGVPTGDGRVYEAGAFRWEDTNPGAIRWDIEDEGEHLGAICVGTILTITRDEATGLINATGVFDTNLVNGAVAAAAVERGTLGGVSVDMDDIPEDSVTMTTPDNEPDPDDIPMVAIEAAVTASPDFPLADDDVDWDEAGAIGRVLAYATADDGTVNVPVVAGTYLWLPEGADPTDLSQYMLPFVDVFTDGTLAAVPNGLRAARENMLQLDQAAQDEIIPVINGYLSAAVDAPDPAEGDDGAGPPASVIEASAWTQFREMPKLAASLFREPTPEELPTTDGPTHVSYANGRMFGWVAQRGVCHDGVTGSCLKPPLDNVDLSTFLRSKVELDDGSVITAGVFTMGTGHDNDGADVLATKALFDDTRTVAGIVTVGVNDRGMWFSGAAAPWLGDWDRRVFASCAPSGHWRRERSGQWSLRAVLSVPVPGFPTRLVASAVERANIAILTEPPTAAEQDDFLGLLKQDIPEVVLLASALVDEMEKRQRIRASLAELDLVVGEARADIAASLLS